MKQLLFILILAPWFLFGQKKDEIKIDSFFITVGLNDCGDSVYFENRYIEYRGGRKVSDMQPVGFDANNPCVNIKIRDTTTLLWFYGNPVIDYGRQQAQLATRFIFQKKQLAVFNQADKALRRAKMPSVLNNVQKIFQDSLVGNYKVARPGVADATGVISIRPNGSLRLAVNSTNYVLNAWGDNMLEIVGIPANESTFLYQIERKRFISLHRKFQLVVSDRQVINAVR